MEVERNIHGLVGEVREHVEDFTVLTIRRKHPEIDRDQLTTVMAIVRQAIDDGFMTKIDKFMHKLDDSFTKFVEEANPLEQTVQTGGQQAPMLPKANKRSPKKKS